MVEAPRRAALQVEAAFLDPQAVVVVEWWIWFSLGSHAVAHLVQLAAQLVSVVVAPFLQLASHLVSAAVAAFLQLAAQLVAVSVAPFLQLAAQLVAVSVAPVLGWGVQHCSELPLVVAEAVAPLLE